MARHTFVSAVADGTDASLVRPSNWNAEHDGLMETNTQPGVSESIAAGYCAYVIGLPYIISASITLTIDAAAVLVVAP